MKMLYSILLCAILSAVAVEAQKQRVLLEYPFFRSAGNVPEVLMFIEELVEEFGEDRLIPFIYTGGINHHAELWIPELWEGLPYTEWQFMSAAINRRTDHNPFTIIKGIHRQGWRHTVASILEEEPILEIIPQEVVVEFPKRGGIITNVKFDIVWHKPDSNIRLEFALLQDSARLTLQNKFDTVPGHFFEGKGNPLHDHIVRNLNLSMEEIPFDRILPGREISYDGRDTVQMSLEAYLSYYWPDIQRWTVDRNLYKLLFKAVKNELVDFDYDELEKGNIHASRVYIPVVNVAIAHGRDFIFIEEGTSVTEEAARVEERAPLRVYPNPANTWLTVEHQAALEGGELEVIDMMGRTVVASPTGSGSTSKLRVSHLPEGMYTVLLRHQGRVQAGKVMVRK